MAERELFADGIRLSERQFEELIPNTDLSGGNNNESDSDDDATEQIGKISVYKHCFCYLNMPTTRTKDPLFRQPMRLWLAH